MTFLLSSHLILLWCNGLVAATDGAEDVDPGADFGGYVEEMERRDRAERLYEAKLKSHEEWRQTTWAGFAVRKIQGIAQHFGPFLIRIQDMLDESSAEDASPVQALAYVGIRMGVVGGVLLLLWMGAKVLQLFVGSDYEVVEEIVIVHEHETEDEAARARATTTRGKKQKAS